MFSCYPDPNQCFFKWIRIRGKKSKWIRIRPNAVDPDCCYFMIIRNSSVVYFQICLGKYSHYTNAILVSFLIIDGNPIILLCYHFTIPFRIHLQCFKTCPVLLLRTRTKRSNSQKIPPLAQRTSSKLPGDIRILGKLRWMTLMHRLDRKFDNLIEFFNKEMARPD